MNNEDLADMVSKALRKAWNLGQTYLQQADSEHWPESDATWTDFNKLVEEVKAEILNK